MHKSMVYTVDLMPLGIKSAYYAIMHKHPAPEQPSVDHTSLCCIRGLTTRPVAQQSMSEPNFPKIYNMSSKL